MIEVRDLTVEEQEGLPKPKMREFLHAEAPHFMYTLMNMPLPPIIDRLRLPMVATASKTAVEELNQSPLHKFILEFCQVKKGAESLRFSEFYDAFQKSLDAGEKHLWSKIKVRRELPNRHRIILRHAHDRHVQDLVFKPSQETEAC